MAEGPAPALKRPVAMHIDLEVCIDCGACDDLAPGIRDRSERIAVSSGTLEAMAACPVGAILWSEGDTHEQDA